MSAFHKKLLWCCALLLTMQVAFNFAHYFADLNGGRFGGDFITFWQTAQRLQKGDIPALYNPDYWQTLSPANAPDLVTWFVYPPFALFGLWPLGGMSYNAAAFVWSLAPLPLYFLLLFGLAKQSGLNLKPAPDAKTDWLAFALLFAAPLPFLSANIFSGQTGAITALCLLAAAYFWKKHPILAGICIGCLAIKPQMGLLIPFALLAARQWRAIFAAAGTILSLSAAATVWLGAGIWTDYLRMTQIFGRFIGSGYDGIKLLAVGPYVSLHGVGAPAAIAGATQAIMTVAVLAVIVRVFWRWNESRGTLAHEDGRLDLRLGMLAAGTLLATPYALSYDTPLLMLSIVPILARAVRGGWNSLELGAFLALVTLPFAQPVFMLSHIPYGFCVLALWFFALYRRYRLADIATARRNASPVVLAPTLPA